MDLNLVIDRFKTDRDILEINDISYISSAVLLPLVIYSNKLCILLQIRSETLNHHPGEIGFPGGATENSDLDFIDTMYRETKEEIGLNKNDIKSWLLFGLFAGLGVLSKYLFIYLGLAMDFFLIYMIYKKKIDFKCLVSIISFLIILLPHLIWLTKNNYITITYGLDRTAVSYTHLTLPTILLV